MERAQNETHKCVGGIQELGTMLSSISSAVSTIKDMSNQIAGAAEQQSVAANSQHDNISKISQLSDQTAMSAQENKIASEELARMAETQRGLVAQFTI
jgi:methyl-accepting chemotaxis protein